VFDLTLASANEKSKLICISKQSVVPGRFYRESRGGNLAPRTKENTILASTGEEKFEFLNFVSTPSRLQLATWLEN